MGINSTEVSYSFGQLGSAYSGTTASAITPPTGKVIVAVYFIQDNTPAALVAEDPSMYFNTVAAAHNNSPTSETTDEGTGGLVLNGMAFKGGSTIYGRWTSVTPEQDDDGGVICYFGH